MVKMTWPFWEDSSPLSRSIVVIPKLVDGRTKFYGGIPEMLKKGGRVEGQTVLQELGRGSGI